MRVIQNGQALSNEKILKLLNSLLILLDANLHCNSGDHVTPGIVKFNICRVSWRCFHLEKGKHPPGEESCGDQFDNALRLKKQRLFLQSNKENLRQLPSSRAFYLYIGIAKIDD